MIIDDRYDLPGARAKRCFDDIPRREFFKRDVVHIFPMPIQFRDRNAMFYCELPAYKFVSQLSLPVRTAMPFLIFIRIFQQGVYAGAKISRAITIGIISTLGLSCFFYMVFECLFMGEFSDNLCTIFQAFLEYGSYHFKTTRCFSDTDTGMS